MMLRRAIRSVLGQTFRDFRLCIYDDSSGDESEDVIEEFRRKDERVEFIRRPIRIGRAANFQDSGNRVETPFFSFLPNDDIMLPEFFEIALAGFRRHPEAALSILPTLIMSPGGFVIGATTLEWPGGLVTAPSGMFATLRYGNPGLPSLLIRREVWQEFGGFDQMTEPSADMDFALRVTARLPVVVSKQPGGIQVMHSGSTTASSAGPDWFWPTTPRMIQNLVQDMSLSPEAKEEAVTMLTSWMKKCLVTRGIMRSISYGEWEQAKRSAEVLLQECGPTCSARVIHSLTALCQRLPGTRASLRAFLVLRAGIKAACNIGMQWQFRSYSKLLRSPLGETF
jgi:hypothetical protein